MGFFSSPYHSSEDESPSFIGKVAGVAKLGAIVGLGIAAAKGALKVVGPELVKLGVQDFSFTTESKLGKLVGTLTKSFTDDITSTSPIKNLMSGELGVLSQGLEKVEQSIYTSDLSRKRIDSFVGGMVGHGLLSNKEAIDNRELLRTTFERVGTIQNPSKALDTIFTDHGLKSINSNLNHLEIAKKFDSLGQQREVFTQLLGRSSAQQGSKETIAEVMGNESSRKSVTEFLLTGIKKEQKKSNTVREVMGINQSDFESVRIREITVGHKHFNQEKYDAINNLLESLPSYSNFTKDSKRGIETHADHLVKTIEGRIDRLYGETGGIFGNRKEKDEITKAFHLLDTGFAIRTRDKKVVSIPRALNVASQATDRIISHLQLPLIPYFRSIPVKNLVSFTKTSGNHVHDLGFLNSAPELRRMFKGKIAVDSRIISSRAGLLSINNQSDITFHKGNFDHFDLSQNSYYKKLNDVRTTKVNNDIIGNMRDFIPHGEHSELHHAIYANQHRLGNIVGYDPKHGFTMEANNIAAAGSLKLIHPNLTQSDPSKLHPGQLADFLLKKGQAGGIGDIAPHDLESALRHLSREASRIDTDLGGEITEIYKRIGVHAHSAPQHGLYTNPNNTTSIKSNLTSVAIDQASGVRASALDPEGLGETSRRMSEKMYQAALHVKNNLDDLATRGAEEQSGIRGDLRQHMYGFDGPGRTHSRLQEGLLDDLTHLAGGEKLSKVMKGADHVTLQTHLQDIAENGDTQGFSHPILTALEKRGFHRDEALDIIKEDFGKANLLTERSKINKIGALLLDEKDIQALSSNKTVQAKLTNNLYDNLTSFTNISTERRNQMTFDLLSRGDVDKTIADRFRLGRGFHPQKESLNPLSRQSTYVTNNVAPNVMEFIKDPIGSTGALLSSIFDTAAGIVDPDAPLNSIGSALQSMLQRPNNIGEKVGLGLNAQDRITAGRSMSSFFLKRVVPMGIAYEAYKNLNSNAHFMGMPGLDDLGANFLGNLRIATASQFDALGLTNPLQNLIHMVPGMDTFFSVRSQKEERDYLFYGDEAVRANRGNIYLSKDPLGGGRIEGYRPSFYRRWKSHWTEEMDIHSAGHSFLPNIENPLGLLNPLVHTNWFADKHKDDRPYVGHSEGFITTQSGHDLQGGPGGSGTGTGSGVGPGGGTGTGTGSGGSLDINSFKYSNSGTAPELHEIQNFVAQKLHGIRSEMGLFGSILSSLPGMNFTSEGARQQQAGDALGPGRNLYMNNYMGFLGGTGEYFRRFIHRSPGAKDDYSPLINNMPTWVPEHIHHGDPYLRTFSGELNLPGRGFQSTHPWDKPLRVRGSTVGLSVNEIIQKWLDPIGEELDESGENITSFGSEVHEVIQKQLRDQGYLMGAEVSIFDAQHNISGTIDAILKGPNGPEIIDIKTQGGNHWGETPEKYIDQINTYMAITGAKSGKLAFVNRDDMSQVRIENFAFDQERWQKTLDKIEYARGLIHSMEDKKMISPFETYDLLTRIEILAKTAPGSEAFNKHVQAAAAAGGFGGFEKQRLDQALHEAHELRKQYKTSNYAYGMHTEMHNLKVLDIQGDGTIVTKFGTLKLAGVSFDKQTFLHTDPAEVFARYGITKGNYIDFEFSEGTFNSELSRDRTTEVIAGTRNKAMSRSVYAKPDYESDSPLAKRALHGSNIVLVGLEKFLHSDNLFLNKITRVRSALEQFERGEVYGSDKFDMHHPFKTGFIPLITSLVNKNPIAAGIVSSLASGMFFTEKAARMTAMKTAGLVGAGVSAIFRLASRIANVTPVSKRYKKGSEFDEYWDAIKYIKATAMANEAKRLSLGDEGFDIDQARSDGLPVGTGNYAKLNAQAEAKAAKTMYGFNVMSGTLQEALATLPTRHKQIAEEIALYGSRADKQKFYDELGDSERRVLGKFLGVEKANIPGPKDLTDIFKKHMLPEATWKGWDPLINEDDIETRSRSVEGIGSQLPSRNATEGARAKSSEVQLPNYNYPTYHNIDRTIKHLMKDYSGLEHAISVAPSNKSSISIKYDLKYDATKELMRQMYN